MKKFRTAVRVILTLILTAALCAGLILTAVSASLRLAFSPANVYETMMNLDFAEVRLPDGYGGFPTILESVNDQLGYFGMKMTKADFNELIRILSIDDILTIFVQDFRTWLMDYGPVPALDPYEMAELALSGADRSVLSLLGMFSDPLDAVAAFLARVSDIADLDTRLEKLEPVRDLLSEGTLTLLSAGCMTLALLILAVNRLRIAPACTAWSAAVSVTGAALLFAPHLMNDWKNYMLASLGLPESTFHIVYLPLIDSLRSMGAKIALAGLTVLIFTIVIRVFADMIRRERELAEKLKAERVNRFGEYGF